MERNCKNCLFWCGNENQDGSKMCRKNPPSVFPIQQHNPLTHQTQMGFMSIWPTTRANDFCGRFVKLEPLEVDDPMMDQQH